MVSSSSQSSVLAASTAATAALALPPSTAPALDFEALTARDLQDHRPARVTRMIPRERFIPPVPSLLNTTAAGGGSGGDNTTDIRNATNGIMEGSRLIDGTDKANNNINEKEDGVSGPFSAEERRRRATQLEQSHKAHQLVRTLVATTPAFVQHMEATHASAEAEEKREWKANLAQRTQLLIEELTGSAATATPHDGRALREQQRRRRLQQQQQQQAGYGGATTTTTKNGTRPSHFAELDSKLHGIEMSDWESKIQWDGLKGDEENTATSQNTSANSGTNATAANKPSQLTKPATDPLELLRHRRNHWLDSLEFDNTVNWEGTTARKKPEPIQLLLELGVAGQSVARQRFPTQRPAPGVQSEEYKQRMEREWKDGAMTITSTADVSRAGSLHKDREKMEKLIQQRQKKRAQMAVDKTNRVTEAMGTLAMGPGKGRTITSSLMGPGGTERTGRPSRHNVGTTSAHELEFMEQLDMVTNHSLVRDLSKVSLREYHRPKLPRSVVRQSLQWQFQIRYLATIAGKPNTPGGGRGNSSTSYQSIMMGTHPGALSKAKLRSEADLSPSEGKLVLLEYCEERPPIQLTKGMAFKIVNYFRGDKARCPVSRGGGDRPTRKKKRSENESPNKTKSASKTLLGDRPPRLEGPDKALRATASDWIGKIPKKTREGSAAAKDNMVDMLPEGVTELLHPKVHGPFIGEVEEGMKISALISLLFVAPVFLQEPENTDFLMILGRPTGGGVSQPGMTESLGVMLREFPSSVYTVGQCEPRTRVYAPNTQGEKNFLGPFLSYQIAKILARTQAREGHGLRFDEIQDRVMPNLGLTATALRQRLKQVALYDKNTQIWTTKAIGYEEYPGVEALGKSIAPEGVAAFETASAAARRLMDLGINQLVAGSHAVGSVGMTMTYLAGQMNAAKEMHRKAKKMYEWSRTNKDLTPAKVVFYEKAAAHLELQWKCLRQRYDVCRFIFEELQLTPWHLTGEFIEVHKKGEGSGMMKLTGLGDPSGLGEGFSFLREADSKPSKAAAAGALNAQVKKITGTEDDLRKLTMKQMAALLRSYGLAQKQIDTLKRWDRVHVIRDLSTKAASDGIGDGLERFARGEKMKLSEQKQVYRKRIQVIWKRQIAALSAPGEGGGGGADAAAAGEVDADNSAAVDAGGTAATTKASQKNQDKKEDSESDSDDDDDFAATFEEELMDGAEANQLVAAHARRDAGDTEREAGLGQLRAAAQDQDLTKDARELAALKRQREEERAAFATAGKKETVPEQPQQAGIILNRKVIRKKIVKTFPDGRVTTTFKYIVHPTEVGKLIAKINEKKEKGKDKTRKLELHKYERGRDEKSFGHAMFEDEDDFDFAQKRYGTVRRGRGRGRGGRAGTPTGAKRGPKPKTLLGKLKAKTKDGRKKRKRDDDDDDDDDYDDPEYAIVKRKGTSNRRERGSIRDRRPHVIFAERLESIRAMVESRPDAGPFHKPVPRRVLPTYYEVISYPMDLSMIRDKIQRYEYRTAEAFVKDFELMKSNAVKFNGAGTPIANEAVSIWEAVKEQVNANQTEIKKLEEDVNEQLSGKPKKKKKKKKKGAEGLVGNIDLGDIDFEGLGSDSDDDGLINL